ncbi:DM13 domain-containing protein [Erythrobacter sp. NE805]|uniref:DM13 domain-containing protein n=1 Tax=Erythrobacter sp. NE805 TaxID=3389875 RepID=UPI00396B2080
MKKTILLAATHLAALGVGFGLGVYYLPILVAERAPEASQLAAAAKSAAYTATFKKDLPGSDALHWGTGTISVTPHRIVHQGELAPGPDYKIYLAPSYVDTDAGFRAIKDKSVRLGSIKSYKGFITEVPAGVNIEDYDTVVIWCEAFGKFITAGKYR